MRCLLPGLVLLTMVWACAPASETDVPPEAITVDLVPAEALTALLPEQLTTPGDTLARQGDLTYRGYFADSAGTGALALVTVARTYGSEDGTLAALNLSYYDSRARFEAIVAGGGERVEAPETAADSAIAARLPEGTLYAEPFGRIVLVGEHYAIEGKSFSPDAVAAAFAAFDPAGLVGLAPQSVVVDSTFARDVE